MRTRPFDSTVAVAPYRPVCIEPVGLKVPGVGSYSSALAPSTVAPPPAIRTRPVESRLAVCCARAVAIEPVGLNVPGVVFGKGTCTCIVLRAGVGVGFAVVDVGGDPTADDAVVPPPQPARARAASTATRPKEDALKTGPLRMRTG